MNSSAYYRFLIPVSRLASQKSNFMFDFIIYTAEPVVAIPDMHPIPKTPDEIRTKHGYDSKDDAVYELQLSAHSNTELVIQPHKG